MMDADTRRTIEWECHQVLTRFINYLDACDYERLAALMAPDGAWFRPGGPVRGPAGVLAALRRRPAGTELTTRHVISNIVVDVIDSENAVATTYLTVYRHDGPVPAGGPAPLDSPHMVGVSDNRLVRTPDGWRISEKRTRRTFERRRAAQQAGGKHSSAGKENP